jgi:probable F420-dependent oxidoreductase
MKIGAMYPTNEVGLDTGGVKAWIDAVAGAGFDHIIFGDHILGMDPSLAPTGWDADFPGRSLGYAPYTYTDVFREPMVLLAYVAARCDLDLATGVIVLPQRQTELVAKQAAEIDLLSSGRFRLAVGAGWNRGEFEALGAEYSNRGRRLEEQIEVLRQLWTHDVVNMQGHYHSLIGCGIGSLPVQRPIPLWIGTSSRLGYERVGRLADGCFLASSVVPNRDYQAVASVIRKAATAVGRDFDEIGIEARLLLGSTESDLGAMKDLASTWRRAGATHVWVETRYADRKTMDEHVVAVLQAGEALNSL